jgi:hypothetical protein
VIIDKIIKSSKIKNFITKKNEEIKKKTKKGGKNNKKNKKI